MPDLVRAALVELLARAQLRRAASSPEGIDGAEGYIEGATDALATYDRKLAEVTVARRRDPLRKK